MKPLILRPASGIIITVAMGAVGALIVGSLITVGDGPGSELWPLAAVAAAAVWLTWTLLWWPRVRLAGEGIEVRNPLRTVRIPWTAVQEVDGRGTLVITTPSQKVRAWAAPPTRPSRRAARATLQGMLRRVATNAAEGTPAEPDVADLIRRIQGGRYRLPTTSAPYESVAASFNVSIIAVTVVLVVGAFVAVL